MKALTLGIIAFLAVGMSVAHAQSWADVSDQKQLGLMISSIQQSIQTSKSGDIRWRGDQSMMVDGVLMDDTTFRATLGNIVSLSTQRTTNYQLGNSTFDDAFGPFWDFQLLDANMTIDGDSCVATCRFQLSLTGLKESVGFIRFYRVKDYVWRMGTINGLLPLLQGEMVTDKQRRGLSPMRPTKKTK